MVTTKRMPEVSIQLDEDKHTRLKQLAARRRVSMAVLAREGIDRVLELAEKQQATVERYLAEQEALTPRD